MTSRMTPGLRVSTGEHTSGSEDDNAGRLAEFGALRQEIERRSNIQHNIFVLQLTSSGVIFSFALARSGEGSPFLLVIPIISFLLCAEYVDQIYGQRIAGEYIKDQLAKNVPGGLGWESWLYHTGYHSKDPDKTKANMTKAIREQFSRSANVDQYRSRAREFSPVRRFCASLITFPFIAAGAVVWTAWNVVWPVHPPAAHVWFLIAWIVDLVFTSGAALMIWRVGP